MLLNLFELKEWFPKEKVGGGEEGEVPKEAKIKIFTTFHL